LGSFAPQLRRRKRGKEQQATKGKTGRAAFVPTPTRPLSLRVGLSIKRPLFALCSLEQKLGRESPPRWPGAAIEPQEILSKRNAYEALREQGTGAKSSWVCSVRPFPKGKKGGVGERISLLWYRANQEILSNENLVARSPFAFGWRESLGEILSPTVPATKGLERSSPPRWPLFERALCKAIEPLARREGRRASLPNFADGREGQSAVPVTKRFSPKEWTESRFFSLWKERGAYSKRSRKSLFLFEERDFLNLLLKGEGIACCPFWIYTSTSSWRVGPRRPFLKAPAYEGLLSVRWNKSNRVQLLKGFSAVFPLVACCSFLLSLCLWLLFFSYGNGTASDQMENGREERNSKRTATKGKGKGRQIIPLSLFATFSSRDKGQERRGKR
jgi:hypothetical protein